MHPRAGRREPRALLQLTGFPRQQRLSPLPGPCQQFPQEVLPDPTGPPSRLGDSRRGRGVYMLCAQCPPPVPVCVDVADPCRQQDLGEAGGQTLLGGRWPRGRPALNLGWMRSA